MKYNKKELMLAFNSEKTSFIHFLDELKKEKKEKKKKKSIENSKTFPIEMDYIFEEEVDLGLSEDDDIVDGLHDFFYEKIDKDRYHLVFDRVDVFEDEGLDMDIIFKVNGVYYIVNCHCEAEWCSDWSVRANLTGTVNIKSFSKIGYFEIKDDRIIIEEKKELYNEKDE